MIDIKHDASQFLDSQDRQQVFRFWQHLSSSQREALTHQINSLDANILKQQKSLLRQPVEAQKNYKPFLDFAYVGNSEDRHIGKQNIRQGQMGCLLLAGGQGSRLGSEDPKGMYPISLIKHKSLFQLCAEKVRAAGKQAGYPLSLAIMTSPLNDGATKQFFQQNHYFGLDRSQIDFFSQGMLPFLDSQGHLFLETASQLAQGPNGNGLCLKEFVQSGIWSKWHQQGIRYLNLIFIDNPLADPFDAELLGFHCRNKADVTLKCAEKENADEKVGVLVNEEGFVRVIEYSEMDEHEKKEKDAQGHLMYRCANLGLFCLSMDFVYNVANKKDIFLHRAWKTTPYIDDLEISQRPKAPNAWKFEAFIFDILRYTKKVAALIYPRAQSFAPLKNATGENSPDTVKNALQQRDCTILQQITGLDPPENSFELAADFYYPTSDLLARWKGKRVQEEYIEPENLSL